MADINAYYYTITHSGFDGAYGNSLISAKEFINLALDNNTPISDINIGTIIYNGNTYTNAIPVNAFMDNGTSLIEIITDAMGF
mgnify:FL=1|jgi:hypothetical protein